MLKETKNNIFYILTLCTFIILISIAHFYNERFNSHSFSDINNNSLRYFTYLKKVIISNIFFTIVLHFFVKLFKIKKLLFKVITIIIISFFVYILITLLMDYEFLRFLSFTKSDLINCIIFYFNICMIPVLPLIVKKILNALNLLKMDS
jgi:hypothetical protein